jgi:putative ABC transport system permease protein
MWWKDYILRLRALLFRGRMDDELEEELEFHIAMQARKNQHQESDTAEAKRQARLQFGSVVRATEECREQRGVAAIVIPAEDLRFAFRVLRKSPGFAAVAILTLAVGIGVNATVFSMANGLLFRGIPVPHPSGLVSFTFSSKGNPVSPTSYLDFEDARQQASSLVDLFAYQMGLDGLTAGGHTDRIVTNYVTGNYFTGLGIKPALGRLILPSEVKPGSYDPVVVLSYSYWQSRFGANPSIIGKSVRLGGKPMTVVGVAQEGFNGPLVDARVRAFLPLNAVAGAKYLWTNRTFRSLDVLGRLRPGDSLPRAKAAVEVIANRLAREHPKDDPDAKAWLLPGRDATFTPTPNRGIYLDALGAWSGYLALALFVLLIACVNLVNLLLARWAAREHEMAVRAALGAGPGRLLKQALAEAGLLAALGCAAGLLLGAWASRLFGEAMAVTNGFFEVNLDFGFDAHVFLYAAGAAVLAVLVAGLAPSVRASRSNPCDALHQGARGVIGGRNRFRKALVVAQIAGSVVLLILAGRATRSMIAAEHTDLGFNPSHLVKLELDPGEVGYSETQYRAFYSAFLERVRALPGVQSAALAYSYPSGATTASWQVHAENRPIPPGQDAPVIGLNSVSPGYFKTMQIRILRGRPFLDTDTAKSLQVAVVNETFSRQFWPNQDPLGKRFSISGPAGPWIDVVGIAADSTYGEFSDKPTPTPYFYQPSSQGLHTSYRALLVRTEGSPEMVLDSVEAQARATDSQVPVWGAETMRHALDSSLGWVGYRFATVMGLGLGLLALALAVGGVYGVVSYDVGRRTHEMGIRIALGASPRNIQRIIFRQALTMLGAGLFFGVLAALGLAVTLGHFVHDFSVRDPLTYLGVIVLISAATLFACYIPTRRAIRVDPMVALKYE